MKKLKKKFYSQPDLFRIEAVIHDGQWYTRDKWAKVAKVKLSVLDNFIINCNYLIKGNNSYRVNGEEVLRWYKVNNLDIKKQVIPNNYAPRLWRGKTETEVFMSTPRRMVHLLYVYCEDNSIENKVKSTLKGYGKIKYSGQDNFKLSVLTVSPEYLISIITRELSAEEREKVRFRKRLNVRWRDITDFDEDFILNLLQFYLPYAKNALKGHIKTLEIFLPSQYDIDFQITEWILRAVDKFDETACVPFSGYLTNVLQKWPYDLPNNELGNKLSKFQRERQKIIAKEQSATSEEIIQEDVIQKQLDYTEEEYYRLLDEHNSWVQFRYAGTLNWTSNNSERFSTNDDIITVVSPEDDYSKMAQLTMSILKTAIDTEEYNTAVVIAGSFTGDMQNMEAFENISDKFRTSLMGSLSQQSMLKGLVRN